MYAHAAYDKEKAKEKDEIYTPTWLVNDILDQLPRMSGLIRTSSGLTLRRHGYVLRSG